MATEEALDKTEGSKTLLDWSQDGRYLFEGVTDPKTKWTSGCCRSSVTASPFPTCRPNSMRSYARLSPNGQWLAYISDETKRAEIYVQTFPTPGGKWQISTNGGFYPVWSRDGKELFYIGADQKLMAVEVMGGNKFQAGMPRPLFAMRRAILGGGRGIWFDVSKDGRFLMPVPVENAVPAPMTVVVNWTAELKK